jgi:predicted GIY-YIG superfamily endonuclease
MDGLVYLLHFERRISERHTCQHYLGWCKDLNKRLAMHRAGWGSRLTQVAIERGIGFEVVRTWAGSRELERLLKNRKHGGRLCPVCSPMRRPGIPAEQLALPLFDQALVEPWPEGFEFPAPPALPMDGYEYFMLQCFRQASAVPVLAAVGKLCEDIPY